MRQGRYDGPFHWHNRKCTVDELKRMQGFPRDYIIPQTYVEGVKQVGNSVCPPVAHQIGLALRYQVEGLEEYAVPLIDADEALSFDKLKGKRAKKTRENKTAKADTSQISMFDEMLETKFPEEHKHRMFKGHSITWDFKDGELNVSIDNKVDSAQVGIDLQFFGGVTAILSGLSPQPMYSVALQGGALMRSILEELWYGNVCPNTGCREATKEAKELIGYIADHHDNLQATLTDKQREILEKFDDCYAELTDINEREIFVYAFRLGARIAIEVMSLDIEYAKKGCSGCTSFALL